MSYSTIDISDSANFGLNMGDAPERAKSAQALSVSAAMSLAKETLESFTITVIGEVSEVSVKPGYKAAYFTIKDQNSSLPCLMWNNRYRASGVELKVGQLVQITGRFTLYTAKGRMNFEAFTLSLAGEGNLRMQVANLAKKLQAEGLTDASRKKPLPQYAEKIGVVTSPRGAAVHDVLRTLRRRFPLAEVLVAGVPVEGVNAPAAIVDGIKCVYDAGADVILVVRGGGSFEDLMPFNDERLARTIAKCPTPIVTGIGHEPDTSIADMVSDFRASTPTAAAEAVSPSQEQLARLMESRARAMCTSVKREIAQLSNRLLAVASRPLFTDEMYLTGAYAQTLDIKADRLSRAIPTGLQRDQIELTRASERMSASLSTALVAYQNAAQKLEMHIERDGAGMVEPFTNEFSLAAARLDDLSPLKTIARGYSIVRNDQGHVVKSVGQVRTGQSLKIMVSDGAIDCDVTGTKTN